MPSSQVSLETISDFLAQKRIAMIGVSRDPKDFSVMLFNEFVKRGYVTVPVNPAAAEISGQHCFARVQDIQPPVDAAIVMTTPAVSEAVVCDCAEAGIRRVWLYSPGSEKSVSAQAVEFCRTNNIQIVPGHCPYMFWRDSHFGHHLHGFFLKIIGGYPRQQRAAA